jgi:hypothetical protein
MRATCLPDDAKRACGGERTASARIGDRDRTTGRATFEDRRFPSRIADGANSGARIIAEGADAAAPIAAVGATKPF